MFIVTVEGQYYAEGKKLKRYKYECNLPDMKKAMSVIKNKIAERKLQRLYPDFVAVRTYAITDVRTEDGKPAAPDTDNPHQMTVDQLKDIVITKKLPINPKEYSDIVQFRQDVADALKDQDTFLINKRIRDEKEAEDRKLAELNPDLVDEELQPTEPYRQPVEPPAQGNAFDEAIEIEDPDNPLRGLE